MHKYVIIGVQGCGKGTQANLLAERFNLTHISVGDIFRSNIQRHTKLAARIKRIMDAGHLVPDEIVDEVVRKRMDEHDWNYGFVLDGFPRNRAQTEFFLESYDIDAVIRILVPDEVVIQRVLARRLCGSCGIDYNLMHHRPAQPDRCDVCGGELVSRADDVEETICKRIADYHTHTEPVIDLFRRKELVFDVDGDRPIPDVQNEIRRRLALPLDAAEA
ncbi:adenylate kinase [Pseudobythopirellula maris]|uniref:Adenylate kinase n=1 Tax=Pseudobythopirellula maris TaxID=2527991 RepID=A0A5C5ZT21_9BACT|nr:nucleoside monophosphate kinase [Pseudobythopirellula maris]TWT90692.1 adenylate kinase [Pseudobythopirellula maris]